ncbi:hypothetical protein [Patulibacter defluvii]|uniref:hypothetical protein n=1 Tax=Patulibacter defluvii TaxID=3095358 RepID=UPI002A74ED61|nr:hypothetical protein [Patulibacter sp. DM4]
MPAPTRLLALLGLLLTLLVAAPSAGAASGQDAIRDEFRKSGKIDGCKHELGDLEAFKRKLGSDSAQYSPELETAIDKAIADHGSCKSSGGGGGQSGGGGGGGGGGGQSGGGSPEIPPVTQESTATTTTETSAAPTPSPGPVSVPAPAVAQDQLIATAATPKLSTEPAAWTWAAIGGAILLAAALGWGLITASGRIGWLQPIGHAMGEAGWRMSARWAEFSDWLRLGGGR